jgi:hypothetical protein
MTRLRLLSLLSALLLVALLVGCGSSSSSSTGSTDSSSSSGSSSTASTSSTKLPAVSSAVASCKHGVEQLPTLRASTRARLVEICDKAGSGDPNATRKAAEEACREIVNASPLPAGSAKERALDGCKHVGASK